MSSQSCRLLLVAKTSLLTSWLSLCGCASFPATPLPATPPPGSLTREFSEPSAADQTEQPAKTAISVITQGVKGTPEAAEVAYAEKKVVSDILSETGVTDRFRRMDIYLLREGVPGRMKVEYDTRTEKADPRYDYALRPGDKILVKEDPSTIIDDLMETVLGPFGYSGGGDD